MSPALPVVSGAETLRALSRAGFVQVSQRGSHVKLRDANGLVVIVPMHDELAPGTLRSILRQATIGVEDFINHLRQK
ncbi:MAG TPA: type II toxin-antitoxin system HicA family toxin [Symbiobacteriaceae bacterium]|nr:type II toxin-antitoxin system HicA family toxin [Symbiobacteriaceae bacterium]